jgi:uncharacterized membrane protein YvbJ
MKNCPNCDHENLDDARFCEECGQPFTIDIAENNYQDLHFCSNCGEAIQAKEVFCSNCGQQLKLTDSPTARVKKELSRRQKLGLLSLLAVVLLLISGFLFGRYYYSYPQQLNRLAQTFKTQDPKKISEVVISEDPNYKVSAPELKKFISYYQEDNHKADFAEFLLDLKNDPGQLADFSLHQRGRYFGIFPRYQLVIQPVYLTVTADQAKIQLSLDDKKLATSKSSNFQTTWGPLTPGSYQVAGKSGDVQSASTQRLIRYRNPDFETDSHVTVSLHKISFKVASNREDAKVLLNDQAVATIKNGQAEIKDVVWHQGMTVQLSFKDNKDDLKSETYQIAAGKYLATEYDANRPASEIQLDF